MMVQVFIGFDERQPVAFQVAAHSVWQHASVPVSITRLNLNTLPLTRKGLTQFTYSRFLAPYLCDFKGVSIFMDADVLCKGDVAELLAYPLAYPDVPVFVVKHSMSYEWASVMVFNNAQCTVLTPDYINEKANKPLKFEWASSVGELPHAWNLLVGYDKVNPDAKLLHYTMGIPAWPETKGCDYAEDWSRSFQQANSTVSFQALMGNSVHVPAVKKRLAREHADVPVSVP